MEKLPKHLEVFLKEVEEMKKAREKRKKTKKSPEPVRHAQGKLSRKQSPELVEGRVLSIVEGSLKKPTKPKPLKVWIT